MALRMHRGGWVAAVAFLGWWGAGAVGPVSGQCPGGPTLTMTLDHTIEVFRVGDFDPSDTHFHPQVFSVAACNNLGTAREVMMSLVIESDTHGVLATGETDPFELDPGTTTISNRDLTEKGGDYELLDYDISPEAEDLEQLVLEIGYLPEGRYCFRLTMEPAGEGPDDFAAVTVEDCLTVTNPLSVEILGPGAAFGDDLPVVFTAHPQMQWYSRASRWLVRIAEVGPGDSSGEDVMENVPVYETELGPGDVLGGGAGGTISWVYPSAAEDLRRGRSYCWQVTASVETSGGVEDVVSEVFCFRRWDPSDLAAESVLMALSRIMPELVARLGPEIETLVPTGAVLLDGEPMDLSRFQEIIDDIASGRIEVQELRIE